MQNLTRVTGALIPAALLTTTLFYFMVRLITGEFAPPEDVKTHVIELVKPFEMTVLTPTRRKAEPPPPPETQPEPPKIALNPDVPGVTLGDPPPPTTEIDKDIFTPSDGDQLPLVQVQPAYPRRASSRGLEGYAVVEFDITAEGLVENPRVVEAFPNTVFNASSIAAILKFKFKPKVLNGKAVPVYNARNKFRYELAEG